MTAPSAEHPGPPCVGLTGAIAAGKSAALEALGRLGAATLSTDAVSHELLGEPQTVQRLVARWGREVAPAGAIDRAMVGAIVFEDGQELRWLESLLHPLVGERVVAWRAALKAATPLAVVEVPLLFEAGMEDLFDATLVVVAGAERRAAWLATRGDGGAEGRSGRQLSEEEKAARATFVVANDGTLADLEGRLGDLWPELVAVRGRT